MSGLSLSVEDKVGDIAARLSGATAIFRRHKIDFCCGGDVSLTEAAAKRGVDADDLVKELAALADVPPEVPADSLALIDYIVKRYHEVHRRDLPELVRLARRVEAVHRDNPGVPAGLADLLENALTELEDHMAKEETVLFPAIKSGYQGTLFAPITVMRHEHDQHAETLRALYEVTHGFELPPGACRSWTALYVGAEKLATDLTEHIHLENNVLFPRFERAQ